MLYFPVFSDQNTAFAGNEVREYSKKYSSKTSKIEKYSKETCIFTKNTAKYSKKKKTVFFVWGNTAINTGKYSSEFLGASLLLFFAVFCCIFVQFPHILFLAVFFILYFAVFLLVLYFLALFHAVFFPCMFASCILAIKNTGKKCCIFLSFSHSKKYSNFGIYRGKNSGKYSIMILKKYSTKNTGKYSTKYSTESPPKKAVFSQKKSCIFPVFYAVFWFLRTTREVPPV